MLWIAVCDDEVMECSRIAGKIKEILGEMKAPCTIQQFYSGRELLQSSENFDMIFLDIIMGGLDGMRTAQMVREKAYDKLLVFISASRDYVFDAYDVEAFQYLLKPIEDKKLKRVLQKAVRKTQERSQAFIIVSRDRQRKNRDRDRQGDRDIERVSQTDRQTDRSNRENLPPHSTTF